MLTFPCEDLADLMQSPERASSTYGGRVSAYPDRTIASMGHKFIYVGTPTGLQTEDNKKFEFLSAGGGDGVDWKYGRGDEKRYNFATGMWCDRDLTGCEDFRLD